MSNVQKTARRCALGLLPVMALLVAAPVQPAHAQFGDILGFLTSTVNGIGTSISGINGVLSAAKTLEQTVVYPISDVLNIQTNGKSIISSYRGWMQTAFGVNISSAKSSLAQSLEAASLNVGGGSSPSQISAQYTKTYGSAPTAQQAPTAVMQQVDLDDAMATDSLGLAALASQNAGDTIQQGNVIEDSAMTATAGTAPQLEGIALAYQIQSLAIEHKLYASELRLLAAQVGSAGTTSKQGSVNSGKNSGALFNLKVTQ